MGIGLLRQFWLGASQGGGLRERALATERVFASLPRATREMRHQVLGVTTPGCTATWGVHEACDFSCTACYLSNTANQTPPLPLEAVKAQLDRIREFTGLAGNVQLTAGEVTLLPAVQLARIVRYALGIGLDPMVMSHGQAFLDDPSYLRMLVDSGLAKIAIHVDCTQRGRPGYSKRVTEQDLMPLRDRFADLVRRTRVATRKPLAAAHTVTVTDDNIDAVPEIMRWVLRNVDAFRMVSFQPSAAVGRTRTQLGGSSESVWRQVCAGVGQKLNPHTFLVGHPDCSFLCLAFVVRFEDEVRVVEVQRKDKSIDAWFVDRLLGGSFRGFYVDGTSRPELIGKLLNLFVRSPTYLWEWPAYAAYRAADGNLNWLPRFVRALSRGERCRVDPLAIVVHNFLDSGDLDTKLGRERLAACAFKVPVDGQMVSMCELNGSGLRAALLHRARGSVAAWEGPGEFAAARNLVWE